MVGCNCTAGLSNTGQPGCIPIQSVTATLILVALSSNGVKNSIDLASALPTWSELINETDASKRWFPLPQFENVELPKGDSQFEESNSGRKVFLRQGVRSFAGELWAEDSSPTLLGKLQGNRCVDFGVYIVDVNGNLIGSEVDGKLYPIPVDNPSWDPKYVFATDNTTSKIMVSFDFNRLFEESTMYMITPSEAGINFNDLEGLIDVNLSLVEPATTTVIKLKAKLDYGTAINKIAFKGAVAADFAVTEVSPTPGVLALDSVEETADGEYTLTLDVAATSGDVIKVAIDKEGFIGDITVTIP